MPLVTDIVIAILGTILVGYAVAWIAVRGHEGWAMVFHGPHPDPWPRGIQEEDRDRPWGAAERHPRGAARAEPEAPAPAVSRVSASVGRPRR